MAVLEDWAENDLLLGKAVGYRFAGGHLEQVKLNVLIPSLREVKDLVRKVSMRKGPLVGYEYEGGTRSAAARFNTGKL
jgi:hypothetical protein